MHITAIAAALNGSDKIFDFVLSIKNTLITAIAKLMNKAVMLGFL